MKRWKIIIINSIFFLLGVFVFLPSFVWAEGWWGKGARSHAWILARGGTIIKFHISGDASADRYKAVLFKDGKYAEVEFGKNGSFDDAKEGEYKVVGYLGGIGDKESYKGGKSFASITVTAHPGETITVNLDANKKTASFSSDRKKVVAVATEKKLQQEKPKAQVEKPIIPDSPKNTPDQQIMSHENEKTTVAENSEVPEVTRVEEKVNPQENLLQYPSRFDCEMCSAINGGSDIHSVLFPIVP